MWAEIWKFFPCFLFFSKKGRRKSRTQSIHEAENTELKNEGPRFKDLSIFSIPVFLQLPFSFRFLITPFFRFTRSFFSVYFSFCCFYPKEERSSQLLESCDFFFLEFWVCRWISYDFGGGFSFDSFVVFVSWELRVRTWDGDEFKDGRTFNSGSSTRPIWGIVCVQRFYRSGN